MMSLCDDAWDLIRSYGVQVPGGANVSGIANPVFRHWCQQKPVSELSHCLIGVLLVLICAISVIGNLLVVVVFTRYRRLRSPANILIVNLAASDLLNGLLHPMAAYSAFQGSWSFGKGGCEAYAALCGLFGLVSIVTLTAIAVERCLVISVKPWHGTVLFTHSKAKAAIGVVWLYCLALVLPPVALGWGSFVPEGFLTSCSFDYLTRTRPNRAYFFFLFSFGFFLPIILIGVCYTFILQTIFQNERAMKLNHVTKSHKSNVKRSEYRAAEMILMVIALFLISWTPYSLIACLGQFGDKSLLTPWVSVLPSLFAKMSTLYNPAIYGLSHRHFRAALKRMFERDSRRSRSGTYFSRNSTLSKSRTGCPCLPLNCTSDVLEDNSSSLTGKKIYVGSPQDNCRPVSDRKSYAREDLPKLCVCGRVKMVSRDFISKLNDSSACFQYIPTSAKLTCGQPRPCISVADSIYKHPFCGKEYRSLVKLHVLDAQTDQRQEISDRDKSIAPGTRCAGDNLHRDQSTSCVSVANSLYKHSFCGNSLIKLHVIDLQSDQRQQTPGQEKSASPENLYTGDNFDCHRDAPCRCFHRFPSNNDFINPFIAKYGMQRPKSKMDPYKRRGFTISMESGLVHDKSVPSVHLPEISSSSEGSIHEFYEECYGCPVLRIKHEGKLNTKRTVDRGRKSGCGDMQWPSTCFGENEQSPLNPPCEFCESKGTEESLHSCNCKNRGSECESTLPKTECCFDRFKICVLEVESESNLKLQKLPNNQLEVTQNQNSKSLALSREELLVCNCNNKESEYESPLLNQECCNKFKTCNMEVKSERHLKLPHNQLKSTPNKHSKILGLSHEELPMCLQRISNSCGDDFPTKNKNISLSQKELPMCLQCISNSCGDDFTTKNKNISLSQEELPMCLQCISNSCGDDFTTKNKSLSLSQEEASMCLQCILNSCGDDFTTKNKSLSLSQEEVSMCLQCISNSCGDDFPPKKSYSNKGRQFPSVHPSLARSLMFHSERSIHQKYQTIWESDHIFKASCLHPEFFGKRRRPVPETKRAMVILEAGQMKEIIRSSSANES